MACVCDSTLAVGVGAATAADLIISYLIFTCSFQYLSNIRNVMISASRRSSQKCHCTFGHFICQLTTDRNKILLFSAAVFLPYCGAVSNNRPNEHSTTTCADRFQINFAVHVQTVRVDRPSLKLWTGNRGMIFVRYEFLPINPSML